VLVKTQVAILLPIFLDLCINLQDVRVFGSDFLFLILSSITTTMTDLEK
jgi:hypothetical protein